MTRLSESALLIVAMLLTALAWVALILGLLLNSQGWLITAGVLILPAAAVGLSARKLGGRP